MEKVFKVVLDRVTIIALFLLSTAELIVVEKIDSTIILWVLYGIYKAVVH